MSSGSFSVRCMQPATAQVLKSFVEVKNNHLRYVSRLDRCHEACFAQLGVFGVPSAGQGTGEILGQETWKHSRLQYCLQ